MCVRKKDREKQIRWKERGGGREIRERESERAR